MDTMWIVLLAVLAIIGAPLFAIFGAASMLLFWALPDTSITGVANDVFSEKFADSPLLVTIPLFTFAGYLMAESGTPQRLVRVSRAWLGWMPGGLAMVCLVASAFFTTFTGGSGITIVAIGGLLYPALVSDKYDENFSLGVVTTGGSLGLLFPPSVPMIIYGVVAGIMIEKLFLAALIPGIISVAALAIYSSIIGIRQKMPRTSFVRAEAFKTLWEAKWEALLPVALLGGMYSGLLRIHEAAAFTAIYTLFIEVWIYRDVSFRNDLPRIIRDSMTLVGAILIILSTAIGFTAFLIQARVPMMILESMEGLIDSQVMFLVALNFFLIGVGMLMDIFSAIVVVVPLIVPIALGFGVDPYHLGVVFLLNLEIGYLTPPVGLNLFIASFRFNKPITQLYRSVLPFIGLLGIALIIVTYIPALSTWLPNMLEANEVDLDEPLEDEDLGFDLDALEDDDALDLDALEGDDDEFDLDALEGDDELADDSELDELEREEEEDDDFGVLDDE
ncbi:MAG: TRAP transporter large permease subunit [Myxococcales bacterium]|nr:TRAP transporter large permease subunit [Myxococcales bacterium]